MIKTACMVIMALVLTFQLQFFSKFQFLGIFLTICLTVVLLFKYGFSRSTTTTFVAVRSVESHTFLTKVDCNNKNAINSSQCKIPSNAPVLSTESRTQLTKQPTVAYTMEDIRNSFVNTPYIFDQFTMVTPSYKRTDNLPVLFNHYCSMSDMIHKIIILWNNVGEPVPSNVEEVAKECQVPVVIKIMPRNNLTSRFIPYKEIETAGVLSIDDDLQLSLTSLQLAFNTWKKYPYQLVGYTPRTYLVKKYDRYKYHPNMYKGTYTMMMTNVAFIHRKYLELFTNTVPKLVRDYIQKTTNGEDITMNVVVGKYLADHGHPHCVAVFVTEGLKEIGNLSNSGYKGLWHRKQHMKQRSRCLDLLKKAYGQLYLEECSRQVSDETDI